MSTSSSYLTRVEHETQVREVLETIRAQLTTLGIEHEHLSDRQLDAAIALAVYRVQTSGQPVTGIALLAALGVGRVEVAA